MPALPGDLVDADRGDSTELLVSPTPPDYHLHRAEHLLPGLCGRRPPPPSTTAASPTGPGTTRRCRSAGVCRSPTAQSPLSLRSSRTPLGASRTPRTPRPPTAARTQTAWSPGCRSRAPLSRNQSTSPRRSLEVAPPLPEPRACPVPTAPVRKRTTGASESDSG